MLSDFAIEQLLVLRVGERIDIVAKSHDVSFAREEWVRRTVTAYGSRPPGQDAFDAVFALPHDHIEVAIVSVVAPPSEAGVALALRFLFVPVAAYHGDPFAISDAFPVNIHARGSLPTLELTNQPLPRRMVEDLQRILRSGDSPLLLGAAQAMIDGTQVRSGTALDLRSLWQLLPFAYQPKVWPCTFALADELPFTIAGVSQLASPLPRGTISDDQARDYPPGRYESALQEAIEAGDQRALDALFQRPTSLQFLKLALAMLGFAALTALAVKFAK